LAVVGGDIEQGEDPLEAAKRELKEEAGYEAADADWSSVGTAVADANRGCGIGHLFFARRCKFTKKGESDDLEEQKLLLLTNEQVRTALIEGQFKTHSWQACMATALVHSMTLSAKSDIGDRKAIFIEGDDSRARKKPSGSMFLFLACSVFLLMFTRLSTWKRD